MSKLPLRSMRLVMIFPPDFTALADFFEKILLFPIVERETGWLVFDAGNVRIALHAPVEQDVVRGQPKLVFDSDDLPAMHAYLKSKHVLVGEIKTSNSDRYFDASGPDHHEFRFVGP